MTQAQKDAIVGPTEGLIVYQTNASAGFKYFDGSVWTEFGGAADNFGSHVAEANISLDDFWLSNDGDAEGIRISNNGNVGIGTSTPTAPLHVNGNLQVGDNEYIDDDATPGGDVDDWIRLNGYVEVKTNSDNHGLVIRDKDNTDYFGLTQKNGWSYLSDNNVSGSYFLRGNGANAEVRGDLNVRGSDVYDNSGNLRLSGEDDVYVTMDYNGNDSDTRAIRFGKNNMGSPTELMRIAENGNVGIGTSTPDRLVNIGSSTGPQMLFTREDNSTASGDKLGELIFDSTDDTAPSTTDGSAVIRATAAENHGNSNKGGRLSLMTKATGSGLSAVARERLRVDNIGRIGIGTGTNTSVQNSLKSNLSMYGNGTSGFSVQGTGSVPNPAEGPSIGFARGGFNTGHGAAIQMIDYDGYSGGLAFLVKRGVANGAGGTFADNFPGDVIQAMTLVNNGRIGVGTGNPQATFHVNGDARIVDLAGSGTRMVVADANGSLSTQSISAGLWTESGSDIYRTGSGDVGIGLTNPNYKFHVTQSNTGSGDNVIEFINTSNNGLVQFNDNLGSNNGHNALESWTNKNNNGGASPYGVFGGSYSSSNSSDGGGVYGHCNNRNGYAVLGVRNSGGSGYAGIFLGRLGYSGGIVNLSDRRLKRDVKDMNEALEIVKNLRPTTYFFDTEQHPHYGLSETLQYGFIAQEIEAVLPDLVMETKIGDYVKTKDKDKAGNDVTYTNFKGYDFPQLIPILTKAIQEQQIIIDQTQAKNAELEARLEALEAKLK